MESEATWADHDAEEGPVPEGLEALDDVKSLLPGHPGEALAPWETSESFRTVNPASPLLLFPSACLLTRLLPAPPTDSSSARPPVPALSPSTQSRPQDPQAHLRKSDQYSHPPLLVTFLSHLESPPLPSRCFPSPYLPLHFTVHPSPA